MKIPISYACGVLSSLSNPGGVQHSDKTIMYSIELAINDDGHNFKKKDLRNALEWLYNKKVAKK